MENTLVIRRNQQFLGILFIMISAIGFGTTPTLSAMMENAGLGIWDRLAIRYVGATLFMLPILLYTKRSFKIPRHLLSKVIFNAVFSFGLTGTLLFLAYQHTTSALATTIHFMYPLIVILLCILTGTEKITMPVVLLALVAFAGLVIISEPWKSYSTNLIGPLLAFASAVTFAWYVMFVNNKEVKKIDGFVLIFILVLCAGIMATIIALVVKVGQKEPATIIVSRAIPSSLVMILFSTLGPVLLFNIGNRKIGGTTSSILSMLEPITAIILGVVVLGEQMHWTFAIGAPMILISALAISNVKLKSANSV